MPTLEQIKNYKDKYDIPTRENKEYRRLRQIEFRKTEQSKKQQAKYNWKIRGVNITDFDKIWEKYYNASNCEICDKVFNENKCLDHDHKTGVVRFILCKSCNNSSELREKQSKYGPSNSKDYYKNYYIINKK